MCLVNLHIPILQQLVPLQLILPLLLEQQVLIPLSREALQLPPQTVEMLINPVQTHLQDTKLKSTQVETRATSNQLLYTPVANASPSTKMFNQVLPQ